MRKSIRVASREPGIKILRRIIYVQAEHEFQASREVAQNDGGANQTRVVIENEQVIRLDAIHPRRAIRIALQIKIVAVTRGIPLVNRRDRSPCRHDRKSFSSRIGDWNRANSDSAEGGDYK